MVDLFTAELSRLSNDDLYAAIADFARAQPGESYRHDFKASWNNDSLKDVAAFANTLGGILIVGVSKGQKDIEAKLVGQMSTSELTTVIAGAVSTNISPTPTYDVFECHEPGDGSRRFCVIRIVSNSRVHIVTKKDVSARVLVRNVDQTNPADGAQLRMLIDRERQSAVDSSDEPLHQRGFFLLGQLPIGKEYGSLANWPSGVHRPAGTYFKLALIPAEGRIAPLDRRAEKRFLASVHENYRRIGKLEGAEDIVGLAEDRSADFYQYQWYHKNLDYECRWRITNSLEVAHATQICEDGRWSIVDVVAYIVLMLRLSTKWWEARRHFGEGVLCANLRVESLELARGRSGQFIKLFGPGNGDFGFRSDVLEVGQQQIVDAKASLRINFAEMRNEVPEIVTSLVNSLLRTIGHGVFWTEFKENVGVIADHF